MSPELATKLLAGVMLAAILGAAATLADHSNRLVAVEVRNEAMVENVKEIKADVKQLLEAR